MQEGEGLKLEFKESLKNIDKEIVAFANAEGGRIFLGISDNNKIKGIKITNALKSQIQDIARNCDPSIDINLERFDKILIINIKEGKDKPYKCSTGFYLRKGANSQKLKRDEILKIAKGEGTLRFDKLINYRSNFKKDFDKEKLKSYLDKSGIKTKLPAKDILLNLGMAEKQKEDLFFNNTGILFFSKNIRNFFIHAYITCARYKGKDKVYVIDRKDFSEDIITNIDSAVSFVEKNTRLAYEIKGLRRKEIPEYPIEALREAITNALMHRDYFHEGANVFVEVFSDRIEISNPGGLPNGLKKEEFGKKSVRRNPLIADILHRAGLIEKLGTGINRMKEVMLKYGLKKPIYKFNDFFTVIFYGPGEKVLGEKLGEKLGENERKILLCISKNKYITLKELSKKLDISDIAVYKNISKLKKKGLVKRIGPAKGGYWEVIKR